MLKEAPGWLKRTVPSFYWT